MSVEKKINLNKMVSRVFVVVAIIPLLLLSTIYLVNIYQFHYHKLRENNIRLAKLIADNININLRHSADDLIVVKSLMEEASELKLGYDVIFEKSQTAHRHFLKLQYADEDGVVRNVYPRDDVILGNDVSRQPYFYETLKRKDIYWSATYISMQLNKPVVSVNIPYNGGVLSAVVTLQGMGDIIERLDVGEKSYMAIVDQNGYYIAHSDHEKVLRRDYNIHYDKFIKLEDKEQSFWIRDNGMFELNVKGINHTNWSVWVAQENYEAYSVLYRNLFLSIALLLIVALSVLKFSKKQAIGINKIINSLLERIKQVASGKYLIDEEEKDYDEINELRDGINVMVDAILQRQEALRESHEKYRALYWEAQEAFMIVSPSEGFISANPATVKLFACEDEDDFTSLNPAILSPEYQEDGVSSSLKAQQMMAKALEQGSHFFEWTHKRKNGELFYATVFLTKINYGDKDVLYATVRDVTENKKMRELMVQTEKMMSIGNLAAGMAHEINNPLGVILQSTQNLKRRLQPDIKTNIDVAKECNIDVKSFSEYLEKRQIIKFIDGIAEVGNRAAEIVKNMLQFSRQSEKSKSLVSLEEIVDGSILLAQKDYDLEMKYDFKFIKIDKSMTEGLKVSCVKSEIEQVIFNLLKNSAQAFWENKQIENAKIRIKGYEKGKYIVLEIEDNGPGMNDELKRRVFEPFFTTKPVGVGTGLGLSVSYFIIAQNHQGLMEIDSQAGEGTRFIIKFPCCL